MTTSRPAIPSPSQSWSRSLDVDVGKMALYGLDRARKAIDCVSASGKAVWVPDDTSEFDCMHYFGNSAIDNAAAELGLRPGNTVVDLGSGFGATGRYLATNYGARVVGIELQKDIHDLAEKINGRSGSEISEKVRSVNGDFLTLPLSSEPNSSNELPSRVNHVISLLCILHIRARAELFGRVSEILVPGGRVYIEDYFVKEPLDEETSRILRDVIFCPYLPDEKQYRRDLEEAGLQVAKWQDMTSEWGDFVHARAADYRKRDEVDENLAAFYDTADWLLRHGKVGGCRITAAKPTS
ncbi:methyltransferase domain-containing protein [Thozetella sp. PMI_491]|nr:methyltransferase domain-containing protein [Thozetella sp. PMI_491]